MRTPTTLPMHMMLQMVKGYLGEVMRKGESETGQDVISFGEGSQEENIALLQNACMIRQDASDSPSCHQS